MIVDNSVLLPTTVTVVVQSVWIFWTGVFKVSGFLDSIGDLTLAASPEVSKRSLLAFFCSQAKVLLHVPLITTYHRILTHSQ